MKARADTRGAPGAFLASLAPVLIRPESVAVVAILVSYWLVWPVGEYAVEDDWAYTRSLQLLSQQGELRILDWNPMTLVGHLWWGSLFTALFGFGFTVAKVSTVALLVLECLALIDVLRRVGASERWIRLALLTLIFNPLHFFQSFLYATDVPTLAWMMLALACYLRGLEQARDRSWLMFLLGSSFASMAWATRQPGLLIAAAMGLYLLSFDRVRLWRPSVLASFLPVILSVAGLLAWYEGIHGATVAHRQAQQEISEYLVALTPAGLIRFVYVCAAYLVLFIAPLLVAVSGRAFVPQSRRGRLLAVGLGGLVLWGFGLATAGLGWFPYLRNKLTAFGYFIPNEIIAGSRPVWWPAHTSELICFVLLAGLLAVCGQVGRAVFDEGRPGPSPPRERALRVVGLALGLSVVYVVATAGIGFDRHLLIAFPSALVLAVASLSHDSGLPPVHRGPPRTWAAVLVLALFATYSVVGTQEIHAISRAAFRAGEWLMEEGVDPVYIDAGYAFDGWYVYERSERARARPGFRPGARRSDAWFVRSLFPLIQSRYQVATSTRMNVAQWIDSVRPAVRRMASTPPLQGRRVIRVVRYEVLWPPTGRRLYILEDMRASARQGTAQRVPGR